MADKNKYGGGNYGNRDGVPKSHRRDDVEQTQDPNLPYFPEMRTLDSCFSVSVNQRNETDCGEGKRKRPAMDKSVLNATPFAKRR